MKPSHTAGAKVEELPKIDAQAEAPPIKLVKTSMEVASRSEGEPAWKAPEPHFMGLPTELRVMIYERLFIKEDPIFIDTALPPITRTNRRIREESLDTYYRRNNFTLKLKDYKRGRLMLFLEGCRFSDNVRLDAWHECTADWLTLRSNMVDWLVMAYRGEAPVLGLSHQSTEGEYDRNVRAHRIAKLFAIVDAARRMKTLDSEEGRRWFGDIIDLAEVCGERAEA
ncbi:hypothetical protein BLS_008058 [Venturia inaequalis]|uniref:Uncharacterized protein n=1 Tax=Venturia inaequalis TaxID=5025 RepID=A0A8H3U809_VENIN|nr:hypothetical protein EG328_011037 [Venturia inaequalis]KAE9964807.1 hypothetical protein BLS_008058 [Venturia inaequalis]KAE9967666.1 hypothetical protein EG327_011341 [Venturia inaequalis]RDI83312.1 hypothetical protein Vi05172_g6623 [Venturia inaequalis]